MAFERGGRNYRGVRPGQEMWTQNFVQQDKFIPALRSRRDCGYWTQHVAGAIPCDSENQNGFMFGMANVNGVNFGRPIPPVYDAKNNVGKNMPLKPQGVRPMNGDMFIFSADNAGEMTTVSGVGELTWLSSKAGLITCKQTNKTVSFQTKDFCDQAVTDLRDVLCVGFTLCYQATTSDASDHLIATNVAPLQGIDSEKEFFGSEEVDLEAAQARATSGPPRSPKDLYSVALESKAIPVILSVFKSHGGPFCQLSSLHSHICSTEDRELNLYIGTSSLKRRQFIEKRTHLFDEIQGDQVLLVDFCYLCLLSVRLQPPTVYQTVKLLSRYLLCRGGVTSTKALYDFYLSCPELVEERQFFESSGGQAAFIRLIKTHSWIFALFPSQGFVSARRNLPHFDYAEYFKKNLSNYAPSRRGIPSSPMLNPITSAPIINPMTAPPATVSLTRPGSTIGQDSVSHAFSVPQAPVNNLQSVPVNYNQFPPKRSTSLSNPPSNAAWNDIISTAVPPVNGLPEISAPNNFPSNQFNGEFIGDSFSLWNQARSYSTGSSSALSGGSNYVEPTRKVFKDSSTQTDLTAKDYQFNEETLRELCGRCAERIASALPAPLLSTLLNNLSLSHSPVDCCPSSPNRFNTISSSLSNSVNSQPLGTTNHLNGAASQKSSSSSSASIVSPTEDVYSLSSGTPTTVEGSPEQEGRDYDPFKTLVFLNSDRGLSNGIF
uniref:Endo/exonuclease/phosphatase domain-containing protein n=1 Tax=Syphacia muris TaxID=451379 RepID=A0A0N5AT04_9BILA